MQGRHTSRRFIDLTEQIEIVMDGVINKESKEKVETLLGMKIKCDLEWTSQGVCGLAQE